METINSAYLKVTNPKARTKIYDQRDKFIKYQDLLSFIDIF